MVEVGQTLSHYRVLRELSAQGLGEVYEVEDVKLGKHLALKFLPSELVWNTQEFERFRREALAASELNHPNICTIHEIDEGDGKPFVAMEFLDGKTLKHHIAGKGLPLYQILDLAIQLCDALDTTHRKWIVHRDLKPKSIFVTKRNQAKILHFGLAPRHGDSGSGIAGPGSDPVADPEAVVESAPYMSPELVRNEEIDPRSDLFSLGVLLYEMATGVAPFLGVTSSVIFESILTYFPAPLSKHKAELPPGLQRIVDKALQKSRLLRYQNAAEFGIDLRQLKRELELGRASLPREAASASRSRTKAIVIGGGLALAGLVTTAWFSFFRSSDTFNDSIAVISFANTSGNPDNEYLSEGIAETLVSNLSQLRGLRVAGSDTAFFSSDKNAGAQRIGRELHVRTVLTGQLLSLGDSLNLQVQLVETGSGSPLWSQQYTRDLSNVVSLEEDLSRQISEHLHLQLKEEERHKFPHRYTDSEEAYQLYLKGRFLRNQTTKDSLQQAIDYYQQAIDKDPSYALAYARLSEIQAPAAAWGWFTPHDVIAKAEDAAHKALEIDANLGEAYTGLGIASYYDWDWVNAEKYLQRAVSTKPSYATALQWHALSLVVLGQPKEAEAEAKRAVELDPLSPEINYQLASVYYLTGQHDEAIEQSRKTLSLDPNYPLAHFGLARAYVGKGLLREALSEYQKYADLDHGSFPLGYVAFAYGQLGEKEKAMQILQELGARSNSEFVPSFTVALIYAGLDERDVAFSALELAFKERAPQLIYLNREPFWNLYRSDPRFGNLTHRVGLPGAYH